MTPSRRWLLLLAGTAVTAALLLRVGCGAWAAPGGPFATPVRLDPNTARVPELMALHGIGRTRAAAIVLHRVRHGPFERLEDLLEVDGIGATTLERLRPWLVDPAALRSVARRLR